MCSPLMKGIRLSNCAGQNILIAVAVVISGIPFLTLFSIQVFFCVQIITYNIYMARRDANILQIKAVYYQLVTTNHKILSNITHE